MTAVYVVQMMHELVDEIRKLEAKLSEYKQLYFLQMREREMAGAQYVALHDELDENKQVFHVLYQRIYTERNIYTYTVVLNFLWNYYAFIHITAAAVATTTTSTTTTTTVSLLQLVVITMYRLNYN